MRTFALLAMLLVGVSVSWAQDASLTFDKSWGAASKGFGDGSTATFDGGGYSDLKDDCITLGSSASLTIKAKDGSAIKGIKVNFKAGEGHDLTFNGNAVAVNNNSALWISENAVNEIVITNTTASNITRVELIYDSKNKLITDYTVADGKISLDISKLNAYRKHAYSTTTSSLYSTASGYDAYSFIEFEKPIDLSGLTNLTVNYSGDNIVNHIEFYAATGGAILPKYGSTNIDYTDAERAQLTSVKKIQIGSNTQKGKMDISSIVLTLTHIDPSARMISAKEINTYTGKKVVLTGEVTGGSCKPKCIWNKATKNADDSYTLGSAVAYQDNYEFTPTETGDYYFAVRAYQQDCGHDGKGWNTSALDINNVVKVHVDLGYTVSWDATQVPAGCDAWYTIGDNPEKIRTTSSGIAPGTTITYTATDGTDNNWVINGWYKVDVPTSGDGGFFKYSNTYSENISGNLDVRPEFRNTHIYIANAGDNGTAIVYAASDDNKVNISGNKYKPWEMTGGVKFEAQAASGYEFVQWNDGNKDNPRTVTEHADGTTYTYTAQFAKALVILDYKPQCNHYGDRTHGDNYFDINRLNPGDGVTIGTADNGTGKKINVPTNGGSVKFVFKEAYNYRDLVGWTISDNADLRARVSCVEFFTDANCTNRVADFWSNSGDKSGVNDSRFEGDANKIKAIRISFKNSTAAGVDGEVSYDINWMCFKFEHADRTYPTLTEGTEPEMYFYYDVDEELVLANTPGYWREYTDATYETIKGDGLIPTNEWNPRYEFPKAKLPAGDYYFAARDGSPCNLGYMHETDLVKVHVISTTAPTDFKITYDWNTGTGNPVVGNVPVDNNNYTYKADANIMGPGQISREGYFFAYWSVTPDGSGTRYSNNAENGETTIKMLQNRTLYAIWNKEGFEGYFNYENRLIAQWNIDLADGARLHEPSMDGSIWSNSGAVEQPDGKTKTTYTLKNAIDFGELVYGGSNAGVKIPVFAGLKFKANANEVKIVVTKSGSEIMNTQLVLAEGVQLQVPYVRNSYRDDGGNAQSPYGWNDRFIAKGTTWGGKTYDKDTWGVVYKDEFRPERFTDMQDCIHHINRDIVYIVAQPDIWEAMTNKCYDDDTKDLFNSGGDEDVHGLRNGEKKIWKKLNFCGNQGTPCIITFKTETTIDRIGVNRNLTYSFYTENIAANSEGAYSKPFPGLRIVGSPKGAKVADVGDTYATYGNAIAMTYGGWAHNGNEFKDGNGAKITDGWGNMTVYYGDQTSGITEGTNSYDATLFTNIDVKKVPVATDGFPVYSKEISHAYSETVNPEKTTNDFIGANKTAGKSYHDQNYGNFLLHESDRTDGSTGYPYVENYNPWTLPCRGAYAKFEPTLPGVLNVHILQEPGQEYYIADEFGRLIKEQIFVKTGTSNTILTNSNGHISINQKDNVKYSFDVYPGKTYYLFSNTAGMGITGFYFEPYVYRQYHKLTDAPDTSYDTNGYIVKDQNEEYELARQDVGLKTAVMTAGPVFSFSNETFDYTNQTAGYHGGSTKNLNKDTGEQITKDDGEGNQVPDVQTYPAQPKTAAGSYPNKNNNVNPLIYDNKAVHVILERSFTKEKWSTIVLPYSMNNLQLETVFGKGTKVVLLRDVQDKSTSPNHKTTINFVYHENQDIIAGYPYMIYPAQNVEKVETNAYLYADATDEKFSSALPGGYVAPSIVKISAVGPNLVTYPNASNNYGGLSCFEWEASYDNATVVMPVGSYVMSDNNMRRVNEGNSMKAGAFKGYLKYVGDQGLANVRMLEAINFGGDDADEATAIENLLFDAGIIGGKTNVYSINGQLIRENTDDLRGLEKGIYIVNGKKYIVR